MNQNKIQLKLSTQQKMLQNNLILDLKTILISFTVKLSQVPIDRSFNLMALKFKYNAI